jgi:hypothetical protein
MAGSKQRRHVTEETSRFILIDETARRSSFRATRALNYGGRRRERSRPARPATSRAGRGRRRGTARRPLGLTTNQPDGGDRRVFRHQKSTVALKRT